MLFWKRKRKPYTVCPINREVAAYVEGDKELHFGFIGGGDGWAIDKNSITRWEPPHQFEPISEAEAQRIRRNIEEGLKAQYMSVEWWSS
jgi:hypothetical protein